VKRGNHFPFSARNSFHSVKKAEIHFPSRPGPHFCETNPSRRQTACAAQAQLSARKTRRPRNRTRVFSAPLPSAVKNGENAFPPPASPRHPKLLPYPGVFCTQHSEGSVCKSLATNRNAIF
jgi:hypothetical protein